MKHSFVIALVFWLAATPGWAGFEEGVRAYNSGDYATAFRELLSSAQQGNAVAQYNLGVMYARGQGVPQDYGQAAQWYQRAAEQGTAEAQFRLGILYIDGQGVPQDYEQGTKWYWQAAQQGHAGAQYNLGVRYKEGLGGPQDYAQAFQWYQRAAEQGFALAQFALGAMYFNGRGVPQDNAQAAQWFRRAADQGDADAQTMLGTMYECGQGVPQDYGQAAQWHRRAAEQGFALSQYNLGLMYANSRGVPQDFLQAHVWFNLAAARLPPGNYRDEAVKFRDLITAVMTPAQLAEAQALARRWQLKPETQGASPPAFPASLRAISPGVSVSPPRHNLIRQVQERLQATGFSPGFIDGAMGRQTRDALRSFQQSKGLLTTGELDEKTRDALGLR